jgi:hypothetical protein
MTALPLAWLALLDAVQGRDGYHESIALVEELAETQPLGITTVPVHDLFRWARAVRAGAEGDAAGALHHFTRLRLGVLARMAATERIEAAVRAGEPPRWRVSGRTSSPPSPSPLAAPGRWRRSRSGMR